MPHPPRYANDTISNQSPTPLPSNRSFGFLFTAVFALVGGWMAWRQVAAYPWWLGASGLTLLVTLAWPAWLAPFNRAWMKLADVLGRIVSPIVLGVLFYLVVTPFGFIKRLTGWDPMPPPLSALLPLMVLSLISTRLGMPSGLSSPAL